MHTGAAYLIVILVWATTPLAIKWSAEAGAPIGAVTVRMMIAVLVGMLILWLLGGRITWQRRALMSYAAAVPSVFGAMALTYRASMHLPSGLISVLFGLSPLLSGLMMQLLPGGIRLSAWHWMGCLLGVLGLAVVFGGALLPGRMMVAALLQVFLAVCLFSGGAIAVQRVAAGLPPLNQTLGTLILSLPCFAALWLVSGEPLSVPLSPRGFWAVLYLALFGSLLGFLCYFRVLSRLPAATVALITLITPVLALAIGMLLNQERPSAQMLLGAVLIVLALGLYLLGDRRVRGMIAQKAGASGH